MSAEPAGLPARISHWRLTFRHWRWTRPFWAGLLTLVAGLPIAYFPYANLTLGQLTVRMATTAGSGSLIIGVLLFVLGLTMWFQTAVRIFAGVATILLALVSLVVSNFGGFLIGFVPALLGGALAVSWAPGVPVADDPGEKAELPAGDPESGGGESEPAESAESAKPVVPAGPVVPEARNEPAAAEVRTEPVRGIEPYVRNEPVHAGARPDEASTEENGRHRAG